MLGLILTPSSTNFSDILSTILFGSLYSGIPYLNTPPIFSCASNIVTLKPLLASINAIVIPAGPPPTIAILSLLASGFSNFTLFRYFNDNSSSIS